MAKKKDGRAKNGGHSTKPKNPLTDKRKRNYREIVHKVVSAQQLGNVFLMLYRKALDEGDVKAGQLLLEYAVGKPTQQMELQSTITNSIPITELVSFKEDDIKELEEKIEELESKNKKDLDEQDRTESEV
jgi:hypothetical protein